MNNKDDIRDHKTSDLLDRLEQDNPSLSELRALLADEESAEAARNILEYRLAQSKAAHPLDTEREWDRFVKRIRKP